MVGKLASLARQAINSPSIHFQASSIALMLFQSFAVPFFIGVAAFGAQMLFLTPVFLAQALLEPSYQAETNAGCADGRCRLNITSVLVQAAILMGIAIPLSIGDYGTLSLILVAVAYTAYTVLLAVIFALKETALAALARHISLAAYVVAFAMAMYLRAPGEIVIANIGAFITASIAVGGILVAKRAVSFYWSLPHFGTLMGGLSFRLPTISFSGLATIMLGYAGAPASVIGEFRIFMAAIGAGRYFNMVPLPSLQTAIHRFSINEDRSLIGMARLYMASFAVFTVAMVVLFPVAYSLAFGEPSFSRTALIFASFFVLVQPLSYLVYTTWKGTTFFNVALPVILSITTAGGFYLLFLWTQKADVAVSVCIAALTTVYLFAAYLVSNKKLEREDLPLHDQTASR